MQAGNLNPVSRTMWPGLGQPDAMQYRKALRGLAFDCLLSRSRPFIA